jgi:putative endonuclease
VTVLAWLSGLGRRNAPRTDKALGRAGERAAARLLRRMGYTVLGRNVRLRIGEADLVCLAPDRRTLVVVEVKTRRRGAELSMRGEIIPPEASVHLHKKKKLVAVTRTLARANGWEGRQIRIDVVAVEWPDSGGAPTLRHHENAVTC